MKIELVLLAKHCQVVGTPLWCPPKARAVVRCPLDAKAGQKVKIEAPTLCIARKIPSIEVTVPEGIHCGEFFIADLPPGQASPLVSQGQVPSAPLPRRVVNPVT